MQNKTKQARRKSSPACRFRFRLAMVYEALVKIKGQKRKQWMPVSYYRARL